MNIMMSQYKELHIMGNHNPVKSVSRNVILGDERTMMEAVESGGNVVLAAETNSKKFGRRTPVRYAPTAAGRYMSELYDGANVQNKLERLTKENMAHRITKMLLGFPLQDNLQVCRRLLIELSNDVGTDVVAVKITGVSELDDKSYSVQVYRQKGQTQWDATATPNVGVKDEACTKVLFPFHPKTWAAGVYLLSKLIKSAQRVTLNDCEEIYPHCYEQLLDRTGQLKATFDFDKSQHPVDYEMHMNNFHRMCKFLTANYEQKLFLEVFSSETSRSKNLNDHLDVMIKSKIGKTVVVGVFSMVDLDAKFAEFIGSTTMNHLQLILRKPRPGESHAVNGKYEALGQVLQQVKHNETHCLVIDDFTGFPAEERELLPLIQDQMPPNMLAHLRQFEYTRGVMTLQKCGTSTVCVLGKILTHLFSSKKMEKVVIDDRAFAARQFNDRELVTPLSLIEKVIMNAAKAARRIKRDRTEIEIDLKSTITVKIEGDMMFIQSVDVPNQRTKCSVHLTVQIMEKGKKVKIVSTSHWGVTPFGDYPPLTVITNVDCCVLDAGLMNRGMQEYILYTTKE